MATGYFIPTSVAGAPGLGATGFPQNATTSAGSNHYQNVDDDPDSVDTTDYIRMLISVGTYVYFGITLPSDFDTMNTSVNLTSKWHRTITGWSDDSYTAQYCITKADGTQLSNPTPWTSGIGNASGAQTTSPVWLAAASSMTKTDWQQAQIRFTVLSKTANMGSDTIYVNINAVRLGYTYNATTPGTGATTNIKTGGAFTSKTIKVKIGGSFVDKPYKKKVGGTFVQKGGCVPQNATPTVSTQRIVVTPTSRSVSVLLAGPPGPPGPRGGIGENSDFVNVTGDTMTGDLTVPDVILPEGSLESRLAALESGGGGVPTGTFITGGWTVDPIGYLILDGSTVVGGAVTFSDLAIMFPSWVSGSDLVLPLADDAALLADISNDPGLIVGSMSRTLSVAQLPAHNHPETQHTHPTPAHNHPVTLTGGGHNHLGRFLTTSAGSGSNADLLRPYNLSYTREDQINTSDGSHSHSGTTGDASPTTNQNAASNTGNTGSGSSIDITPKHLTVRVAVKTQKGALMSNEVVVYKGRTNILTVSLGIDVSADDITSQIRSEPEGDSPLIATWSVAFATDGTDGELVFTLDNTITEAITANSGYMDLKRMSGGEPMAVFDRPLEVTFLGSVTQ